MDKAIAFTAYNRPGYLKEVLDSWRTVRGLDEWYIKVTIDPSPQSAAVVNLFTQFARELKLGNIEVVVNKELQGVLHHPWVTMDDLFRRPLMGKDDGFDFVLRVEDDLKVSDDILDYFSYVAEAYQDDKSVAAVFGYNSDPEQDDPEKIIVAPGFSPWNWGTWHDRWVDYIGPTWDHDYSTYNGTPGNQAGWDWNLNTRVLPSLDKLCVSPAMSRVQNIGAVGTHATWADFPQSPTFREHFAPEEYYAE